MKKNNLDNFALVILSSKNYEYIWPYFKKFWDIYCKEINIEKYFITTNKNKTYYNFQIISPEKLSHEDIWSERIKKTLEKIDKENLLVFTEDCIIKKKINFHNVNLVFSYFLRNKIDYLNVSLSPKQNFLSEKGIYKSDLYNFHRINLQPALWKKKFLIKMLLKKQTPRQFELNASKDSLKHKIYTTNYYLFPYTEIIRKSKLTPYGYKLLKSEFPNITSKFNIMNFSEELHYNISIFKDILLSSLPNFIRKKYVILKRKI